MPIGIPKNGKRRVRSSKPLADRFWAKVDQRGPDECWPWTGFVNNDGYGTCRPGGGREARGAHRISWEIHNGPQPPGYCVCHHCDNPPCVNPAHLFLGTIGDNNADRAAKGRTVAPRGERHWGAKVTPPIVLEIRAAVGRHTDIAARYGLSAVTVGQIRARETWRHIP